MQHWQSCFYFEEYRHRCQHDKVNREKTIKSIDFGPKSSNDHILGLFSSPACFRLCLFRWLAWVAKYLHFSHLNGFSTEWVRIRELRLSALFCHFTHDFLPMFCLSVPLKRTKLIARKAALTTFIGLFSSVLPRVYFQTSSLIRRIIALVTLERFFPWIEPYVCLEVDSCCAGVVTLSTSESFFSSVLALVLL